MPYRPTERTRAKAQQRRETILRAAAELVAERGWAGVTVAAVADRAGVSNGNVYTHFPDKAALLSETFRRLADREHRAVAEATRAAGDQAGVHPAASAVAVVVEVFTRRALAARRLAWALLVEPSDPAVEEGRLVFRRHYQELLEGGIAEGVASGELPPQHSAMTAAALIGAISEALVGPLSPTTDASDPDEVVRELTATCLRTAGIPTHQEHPR